MGGLRWHGADAWIEASLAGADGAWGGDRSAVIVSHRSNREGLVVDLPHAAEAGVRLRPGGPPRCEGMRRHQAALVSGKLTRVTSGVNLPPLEVIMSRLREAAR